MRRVLLWCCLLGWWNTQAQQNINVLFLGNSYTASNNMVQCVADLALSTGDTLEYMAVTPGGYTFQQHSTNPATLEQLAAGGWDYVVLQEQSQKPSFPIEQVEVEVFPYATKLDSLIRDASPCAETVFFMTWGRKNGDALNCPIWPPVCTYEGMDSLLRERYMMMADMNQSIVSPVGAVWRHLRTYLPFIELYSGDESHPSTAGTYAAACSFYAVLYRKDPTLATFNFGLEPGVAASIRAAAKTVVYDSLAVWLVGTYDVVAAFDVSMEGSTVYTLNLSENANYWHWDMGDGSTYDAFEPVHTFETAGNYLIQLEANMDGCLTDTSQWWIEVLEETGVSLSPTHNPVWVSWYTDGGSTQVKNLLQEPIEIYLFQVNGQPVHQECLPASSTTRLPKLSRGIYILKTHNEQGQSAVSTISIW